MDKATIIAEILRVARGAESLSQREFEEDSSVGLSSVRYYYGTWNQAVLAAGLIPNPSGGTHRLKVSDEEYLEEIISVTKALGRKVSEAEMNAKGRFSSRPYYARWKSFARARELAYEIYGFPIANTQE